MRYITVEDVTHTGIQTQITPYVQTHCLLVARIIFFIYRLLYHLDLHCIQFMAIVTANTLHRRLSNVIILDFEHLTAVKNEFMKNKQ